MDTIAVSSMLSTLVYSSQSRLSPCKESQLFFSAGNSAAAFIESNYSQSYGNVGYSADISRIYVKKTDIHL